MKLMNTTKTMTALLTVSLLSAVPAFSEEAETDIEIINGVPVDPALKAKLMETDEALTVQELLELSQQTREEQQAKLEAEQNADQSWMGNDPLGHLESEMFGLVKDIDRSDTADPTQARGEEVVRKMDVLIAMLEEACSACASCNGSGQANGNKAGGNNPASDSTLAQGPGGSGDLNAAGEGNNRFEDLDPEQRQAILRAQQEQQGLPPEYSALLTEYYQRLASEKALDAEADEVEADAADETPGNDE